MKRRGLAVWKAGTFSKKPQLFVQGRRDNRLAVLMMREDNSRVEARPMTTGPRPSRRHVG